MVNFKILITFASNNKHQTKNNRYGKSNYRTDKEPPWCHRHYWPLSGRAGEVWRLSVVEKSLEEVCLRKRKTSSVSTLIYMRRPAWCTMHGLWIQPLESLRLMRSRNCQRHKNKNESKKHMLLSHKKLFQINIKHELLIEEKHRFYIWEAYW